MSSLPYPFSKGSTHFGSHSYHKVEKGVATARLEIIPLFEIEGANGELPRVGMIRGETLIDGSPCGDLKWSYGWYGPEQYLHSGAQLRGAATSVAVASPQEALALALRDPRVTWSISGKNIDHYNNRNLNGEWGILTESGEVKFWGSGSRGWQPGEGRKEGVSDYFKRHALNLRSRRQEGLDLIKKAEEIGWDISTLKWRYSLYLNPELEEQGIFTGREALEINEILNNRKKDFWYLYHWGRGYAGGDLSELRWNLVQLLEVSNYLRDNQGSFPAPLHALT